MVAAKAPPAIEANIDSYYPTSSRLNNAIRYWLLHPDIRSPIPKSAPSTPPATKPTHSSIQKSINPAPLAPPATPEKPAQPTEILAVTKSPSQSTHPPIPQSINPAPATAPSVAAAADPPDDALDLARIQQDDAHARTLNLSELEPWPDAINDAPALFDEVEACYPRHLYLPPGAAIVLTIWVPHAHAINAFIRL
jgi:hypothetical protein